MRRIYLLALAVLFIAVGTATGQVSDFPPVETLTPETLFATTIEPLYGLLVLLSGYLSAFIPGVKRFSPFVRTFAFALAFGLGVHLFGGASVWKIALTYFLTSGLYITFFKNIFASPKAEGPSNLPTA
jgi:hypothetical protein